MLMCSTTDERMYIYMWRGIEDTCTFMGAQHMAIVCVVCIPLIYANAIWFIILVTIGLLQCSYCTNIELF